MYGINKIERYSGFITDQELQSYYSSNTELMHIIISIQCLFNLKKVFRNILENI